jgi:excisionase family DNA binding protein
MNVFEGEKGKEEAHETKECERAWTRDVPLVGPALEGNESAETKGGAPDILQPCESGRRRSSARRLTTRALQSGYPNGRGFCAGGGTAADLVECSSIAALSSKGGSLVDRLLLNYKQAACYLSVSEPYLRRLKSLGKIPYVEFGSGRRRAIRFNIKSLDRWVETREIK